MKKVTEGGGAGYGIAEAENNAAVTTGPGSAAGLAGGRAGIAEADILSNTEMAKDIYHMVIRYGDITKDAKPGRFINVYLRDKSMLLPRPISICQAEYDGKSPDDSRLTLVYRIVGKGTKVLSEYREGDTIKVSSPLGNGYDIDAVIRSDPETVLLAAGGLGVPPMVELAKTIWNLNVRFKIHAALGFQDELFLVEKLKEFCDEVHVATDRGSAGFRGTVLEMMEAEGIEADYYLSCGPKPMLAALAESCGRANKPLQVSLEERMGCGYGACVGCTCRIRETSAGGESGGGVSSGNSGRVDSGGKRPAEAAAAVKRKKVCTDGPVFFGSEVVWDE
jgi:dihydroorotate dehydrogenase electron transfer subunit